MGEKSSETFLQDLAWRGLVYAKTEGVEKVFERGTTMYLGLDLTADSFHIGHLLGLLVLKRAIQFGNKVIPLMGGGTTMIGDPSGKDNERPLLSKQIIEQNKVKLRKQAQRLFQGNTSQIQWLDNADWLMKIGFVDFQREVGKFFPINTMLEKESVKTRLERQEGMSFAEFSYQLLQAYDFLVQFERYGCEVQIGGSDQWGNIVQGVELIRKRTSKQAFGLVFPLIVDPTTGKKFGKTEGGETIWLDGQKTHPFKFYQFFINCDDTMAPMLMRYFSFKSKQEIETIEQKWNQDRGARLLQKELACELVAMVHGKEVAEHVRNVASVLFEQGVEALSYNDIAFIKQALPHCAVPKNTPFILEDALVTLGLASSKGDARRLMNQGGIRDRVISGKLLGQKIHVIQKGKREYGVVEIK